MDPLLKAGREGPRRWYGPEKASLTSYAQLFPAPCMVPLALLPEEWGPAGPLFFSMEGAKWEVMAGKETQATQAVEAQEATSVWGPGSEAWEAAQRTRWEDWWEEDGAAGSRGALPQPGSSVQPPARSRAPGHPGGSGVTARSSGGDASMAPEPGNAISWVLCGAGRGEVRAEGTSQAGRRLSQRACSPPPFPRTGLASLGYKRGAGTMGVLCPGEALKGPQTNILKMKEALLSLPVDRSPFRCSFSSERSAQGTSWGWEASQRMMSLGLIRDPEDSAGCWSSPSLATASIMGFSGS